MTRTRPRTVRQAGFSFIEILVVMAIITVLVGAVVVVIPRVTEAKNQNVSTSNVRNMIQLMLDRKIKKNWQPYNGKNFVLSLVAYGLIDPRNKQNLETFFSPGDAILTLAKADPEKYKEINQKSLDSGTYSTMTSYAGRRNRDREYVITPDDESQGVPIICDDDTDNIHHPSGLIMGYTNSGVRLMEWEDLEIPKPSDMKSPEPFLGDQATVDLLRPLSSD